MWTLLLFTYGCLAYADVSKPATIYIRVSDKPINLTSPRFPTDIYPPNLNTHYNITVNNYTLKLTIISQISNLDAATTSRSSNLTVPYIPFAASYPPFHHFTSHLDICFRFSYRRKRKFSRVPINP